MVSNLKEIVNKTGAHLVISSTWRKSFSVEKFKEMFSVYGWPEAPVISKTPLSSERHRGKEIEMWLAENKPTSYIIIDDDTDFLDHQLPYFIQVDFLTGLTKADAINAIIILEKGNEKNQEKI